MTRPRLIVLSGEAGAGKDSVSDVLVARHGFVAYSLAAPLKRFLKDMFGFTDEQLYGRSSARNEPDPRWARPCPRCGASGTVTYTFSAGGGDCETRSGCHDCAGTGTIDDNSVRRIGQLLGKEFLRDMVHPDALTIRARPEIAALLDDGQSVVVNQARFSNDRDNLRRWLGADRVHVHSPSKASVPIDARPAWRRHDSETDQPDPSEVEHVLVNDGEHPFPRLPGLVAGMLDSLYGKRG